MARLGGRTVLNLVSSSSGRMGCSVGGLELGPRNALSAMALPAHLALSSYFFLHCCLWEFLLMGWPDSADTL